MNINFLISFEKLALNLPDFSNQIKKHKMKTMQKFFINAMAFLLITVSLSGCFATMHVVGEGGTYNGKSIPEYDVKKKKWFLFSAIPLDDVTVDQVAGDAQNYTVRETFTFGDIVLSALTFGIASPRTIRVSKSSAEK